MKVKRYTQGASNVSELQAQRNVALSPQEAAQAAAVPYAAVADIAETGSGALRDYQVRQNEIEDKNDATQMGINTTLTQSAMKNTKLQAETEGWSDEQYSAAIDADIKNYVDSASMIGDRNRGEALQAFNANSIMWKADANTNALIMKTNKINKDQEAAYQKAQEEGDYVGMKLLSDIRFETDNDKAAHDERNRGIDSLIDIDAAMEEARQLWLGPQGVDGVKRLHKEQMENPNKNDKTQAAIISGLNNMITNINSAEKDRIDLEESIVSMEVVDIIQNMSDPSTPNIDPELWVASQYKNPDLSPKFLAAKYEKLIVAQSSAKKENDSFNEFRLRADSGDIMFGDAANRKNADKLTVVRASEAQQKAEEEGKSFGEEQQRDILIATTKELLFAGEKVKEQFKGGLASPRGVAAMGPLFHDLTSDPELRVDLGLEDEEYRKYAAIEFDAMGAGGTPDDWYQAAERYNEQTSAASKDPSYTGYVNAMWDSEVVENGTKGYEPAYSSWKTMWNSKPYDYWNKWGMDRPDRESPEFYDYLRYYEDGYKNGTGNNDERSAQAANFANKRFKEKNPPTNLNGEWQSERDGIEGDADYKRIEWFEENKDKEWFFLKDGKYTSGKLEDLKSLKFAKPDREPVRTQDQEDLIEYEATYDGGVLIPYREGMTAEGLQYEQSRTIQFSAQDQTEIKSRMENEDVIMAYEEEIQDWKNKLRRENDTATAMTLRAAIKQREDEIEKMRNPE